jgi:hypothetical protein
MHRPAGSWRSSTVKWLRSSRARVLTIIKPFLCAAATVVIALSWDSSNVRQWFAVSKLILQKNTQGCEHKSYGSDVNGALIIWFDLRMPKGKFPPPGSDSLYEVKADGSIRRLGP